MSSQKKMRRIYILEYWDPEQPPENRQKRWELAKNGQYTVGRSGVQSEIIIQHPSISRKHLILTLRDSVLTVAETGSVNGTLVDGRPLRENQHVTLKKGMKLRLGDCPNEVTVSEQLVPVPEENEDHIPVGSGAKSDAEEEEVDSNKKRQKDFSEKMSKAAAQKKSKKSSSSSSSPSKSRSRSRSQEKISGSKQHLKKAENKDRASTAGSGEQHEEQESASAKPKTVGQLPSYIQKTQQPSDAKRALLWNHSKSEIDQRKKIWTDLNATQEQKQRFMKLLGVKDEPQEKVEFVKKSAADVSKGEQLNNNLEKQFYQSVGRKNAGKAGLGFGGSF